MALTNLSIFYTWKNIKFEYNNNKFKISAPTWSDKFNLPDESYSVSVSYDESYSVSNKRNNAIIRKFKKRH